MPVVRNVEFQNSLELERGEVLNFVVQLECRFEEKWSPVMRFDTAHGFAHPRQIVSLRKNRQNDFADPRLQRSVEFCVRGLGEQLGTLSSEV